MGDHTFHPKKMHQEKSRLIHLPSDCSWDSNPRSIQFPYIYIIIYPFFFTNSFIFIFRISRTISGYQLVFDTVWYWFSRVRLILQSWIRIRPGFFKDRSIRFRYWNHDQNTLKNKISDRIPEDLTIIKYINVMGGNIRNKIINIFY